LADGSYPTDKLIQATDGNFYGTTTAGGASTACALGCGTVFKITTAGTLTTLHSFDSTDGASPAAGLFQATNGIFYGTTPSGGTSHACDYGGPCGTIFSLAVGLGPFVETVPASGEAGAAVIIVGPKLTGATSVNLQRHRGCIHGGLGDGNHRHRACRRHYRPGAGDKARRHTDQQREFPSAAIESLNTRFATQPASSHAPAVPKFA
jgi:uncharacterized repeat protein (TIGR03803 family)